MSTALKIAQRDSVSLNLDGLTPGEVAQALDDIAFDYINLILLQAGKVGVDSDVPTQVYILKTLRDAFKKQAE